VHTLHKCVHFPSYRHGGLDEQAKRSTQGCGQLVTFIVVLKSPIVEEFPPEHTGRSEG
jgi:hypothetical protein